MNLQQAIQKNQYKYPELHEPILAPNKVLGLDPETPFSILEFPMLCSTKFNGIRGLAIDGIFHSRTMKEMSIHDSILEKLQPVLDWAKENRVVLDGEFHAYSHNTVGQTRSILAGTIPCPSDFYYKIFYCLPYGVWNGKDLLPARVWSFTRTNTIEVSCAHIQLVEQTQVNSMEDVYSQIERIKYSNKEGLMFIHPLALYKQGRCTIPEGTFFKFKFYSDPIDAKILGILNARRRRAGVERKYNEGTGKAETIHTQDSYIETDIGGSILCELEDGTHVEVPFPVNTCIEERQRYHNDFGKGGEYDLKGMWLQFQRLSCEDRDRPIAIKNVQFRDAKD